MTVMTGRVRDRRLVEIDDETLAEVDRLGGKVVVLDSVGGCTLGELVHIDGRYVIRLSASIEHGAKKTVRIKPRLALAQGAQR